MKIEFVVKLKFFYVPCIISIIYYFVLSISKKGVKKVLTSLSGLLLLWLKTRQMFHNGKMNLISVNENTYEVCLNCRKILIF